jgi:hypothetical protein
MPQAWRKQPRPPRQIQSCEFSWGRRTILHLRREKVALLSWVSGPNR